jgi:hypothetical protein
MDEDQTPATKDAATQLSEDSGFASRKFVGFLVASGLVCAMAVLACVGKLSVLAGIIGTVIGGLVTIYGTFAGANVAMKFAAAGIAKAQINADAAPAPAPPAKPKK